MKIAIRELREDDGEVISFLKIHFSQLWRVGEDEIHDKWVTPSLENEKFPYIFVAWLENTFVGTIFLFIEPKGYLGIDNQPWITALHVREKYRGNSIGKQLINCAKRTAKDNGYSTLYLDTASTQGYYEHIGGWELVGREYWEKGKREVSIMKSITKD